ncbi:MAG: DUF4097 family beta strand repeat-containing protein [Myxococcota bacterium]
MWPWFLTTAHAASAVDTEQPCGPVLAVSVELVCGSLRVRGADRATVRVTGTVDDPEALHVSSTPGQVSIAVDSRRNHDCADLIVETPIAASLHAEVVSANLAVEGLAGRLDLESTSGAIAIGGNPAGIDASSISGSVTVTGRTPAAEVATVSGAIRLSGVSGRVEAESVSGSIDVSAGGPLESLDAETMSGAIAVLGALPHNGAWSLESHTGELRVTIPADTSAVVTWSTFSGGVDTALSPAGTGNAPKDGSTTLGAGDARIELETFTGAIRVNRGG